MELENILTYLNMVFAVALDGQHEQLTVELVLSVQLYGASDGDALLALTQVMSAK